MLQYFPTVFAGVEGGNAIEQCKPDVVANDNNEQNGKENGQLLGDSSLITENTEVGKDEDGEHGEQNIFDHFKYHLLECVKQPGDFI